jgi:branched-chain amino acid transport system permease protein
MPLRCCRRVHSLHEETEGVTRRATSTWMVFAVLLSGLPLIGGDFYVNLASQIFIAAILAASLNLLVGYGGLVSLGHASWIGLAAYTSAWLQLRVGLGHSVTAPLALTVTTLIAGAFGWIALRATGLGFLMITLALSQVLWGTAYRWSAVTNGDSGLSGLTRPSPFGIDLDRPWVFYYFSLAIAAVAIWFMARFINSPFGAALRGTRDEPRRMSALGHDVWLVRWITFVYSGFWGGVAGLLFVYYHKYVHPTTLSLTNSAEALLGVIAGGAGTLTGPLVGAAIVLLLKNYVSVYFERWNMLLGLVFVLIVIFMPDGVVPGVRRWWLHWSRR